MCSQNFIDKAIRKATDAGYAPALGQRDVDWEEVKQWADRVRQPGFRWLKKHEHQRYGGGDIIVARNGAICSGQHRILGGLAGDNPVPDESIDSLSIDIDTQPWK